MLYRFQSQATGDVVMLAPHAEALLQAIGRQPAHQGTLTVEDMPAALAALRRAIEEEDRLAVEAQGAGVAADEDAEDGDPDGQEEARPGLRQRAWPLMQMIERAQAEGHAIVWGV